jgi:hypothetical protein
MTEQTPLPPVKKKRGGQPNNRNALKHGFYARGFDRAILKDLTIRDPQLDDEILLLRVFIRRVYERTQRSDSSAEDINTLRALALASLTIGRLIKINQGFEPNHQDVFSQAIEEAVAHIRAAKGWK